MDKGIGFNRNIKRVWLDAAAAFGAESEDAAAIRARLEPIIALEISNRENIRKTIDILLNIWQKSRGRWPGLHGEAAAMFQETATPGDRLWLHYGLTLLAYPFFNTVTGIMGQISRYESELTMSQVRKQAMAELGQLGSLNEALSRIIFSLRDWGILANGAKRSYYAPQFQQLTTEQVRLETWLLRCALGAQAAEELPLADLLKLPQLFPFHLTVGVGDLRACAGLEVQRQGLGLDMVRLAGSPGRFVKPARATM